MNNNTFTTSDKKIIWLRSESSRLIRKLFANRKRRSECIDEITRERYGHLRGKFFKAGGEHFKYDTTGVTYYVAAVHGETSAADSDRVLISLECRYVMRSALYPGVTLDDTKEYDNIAFFAETFRFGVDENIDEILAPLYITEEKAAKEVSEIYNEFIYNFLKKGQ